MQEHTPAFKIFHYYYQCRVPAMHMVSDIELENRGIVTTGRPDLDKQLANELMDVNITIAKMVELHDNRVPIILADPSKASVIYEIARDHLNNWKRTLETELTVPDVPEEFLTALDALAADLFVVARQFTAITPIENSWMRALRRDNRRRLSRRGPVAPVTHDQSAPVEVSMHTPVADAIARQSFQRRMQWENNDQ